MNIKITCATGKMAFLEGREPDIVVDSETDETEVQRPFARAAALSAARGRPIFIQY
jgi:polysaccharide deacetylase 2 family uncharacterized protein YibQ